MALPQPIHVEQCIAREWTRNEGQHAYLLLSGICRALRMAESAPDSPEADRWKRKADFLDLEVDTLKRTLSRGNETMPGSEFSLYLCTLMACHDEQSLAEALALPIEFVKSAYQHAGNLASELVASGMCNR